ncbi:MAG: AbrB/MazE/SpoVT family DNA-binding domain-containing protein [Propionibacteriaceae bacterium]|jgi:AbrB family looped-hinge helix DNA binding protein|nr:AbrB/MazE/SpoVT family DNA-binding domain-containing protein [Propionibacteriaceae bacterium]
MALMYSTVTAKGQITLPAELRQQFGFRPGQRVAITADENGVRVDAPPSLEGLRQRLQTEMRQQGTWGAVLDPDEARMIDIVERHAQS